MAPFDVHTLLSPHAPAALVQAQALLVADDQQGFRALLTQNKTLAQLSDLYGVNVLHLAVAHGSTLAIRHALQASVDLDATDRYGNTPVLWACQHPAPLAGEMLRQFAGVSSSASTTLNRLQQTNHDGDNALHIAAQQGQTSTCEQLIVDLFMDPNVTNNDGQTVLHLLAQRPASETIAWRTLLQHGADPAIKDHHGRTAQDLASTAGAPERAQALVQSVDRGPALTALLTSKTMPLSVRQRRLQQMIRLGTDVNTVVDHMTPLTRAVNNAWGTLVWVLLVDGRADPNACVNPDQRDHPLYRAVNNPKVPPNLIEVLVAAGADINVQALGQHRRTPLHVAANDHAQNTLDKVTTLLEAGANPLLRDEDGHTPWDLARHPSAVATALAEAQVRWEQAVLSTDAGDAPARVRPRL